MGNLLSKINKQNIFLIDSLGAGLSAISLSVALPLLQKHAEMPLRVLFLLAGIAFTLSVYSLSRYKYADHANKIWLKIIIFANLSYVTLTIYLIFVKPFSATLLGKIYFVIEIVIIMLLVAVEFYILKKKL